MLKSDFQSQIHDKYKGLIHWLILDTSKRKERKIGISKQIALNPSITYKFWILKVERRPYKENLVYKIVWIEAKDKIVIYKKRDRKNEWTNIFKIKWSLRSYKGAEIIKVFRAIKNNE